MKGRKMPLEYFGVAEWLSVFAAIAVTAILGLYVYSGIDYIENIALIHPL
jgi:ABC-type nitrate/sulfonate/bicarbonate transport system permease component